MAEKIKVGNGAREALNAMASQRLGVPGLSWADWILAELWDRGFRVVPLDAETVEELNETIDRADDHTAMLMARIGQLEAEIRQYQQDAKCSNVRLRSPIERRR